jgi:dihydropteroate synthase
VTALQLGSTTIPLGGVTHVMAVINLSPESKNVSSVVSSPEEALARARHFRELGAGIIDLGGQSSHYDNPTIAVDRELARLLPAVKLLVADGFVVSVDTWKPEVATECIDAGAALVNDTGGLADPAMRATVAAGGVGAIVMYVEGANPHDVGDITISDRKAEMTAEWMTHRLVQLAAEGIDQTVLDPGIAINYRGDYQAYTRMQLDVVRNLDVIRALGRPVLVPIPRKQEDHRVAAYISMALEYGADMIRVHDVEMACDLARLYGRAG